MSEYGAYMRSQWEQFSQNRTRWNANLEATAHVAVRRVLDVGCGVGQELLPFVSAGASAVGVDVSAESPQLGRQAYRSVPNAVVSFLQAAAEHLPFQTGSFDVVISRLSLPYTDNRRALAEMARVLHRDGVLLIKIHHGRYYIQKLGRGLMRRQWLSAVHAARILVSGAIYHLLGWQVRNRIVTGETFQTEWMMRRELRQVGLDILRTMPDSNSHTPSYVVGRSPDGRRGPRLPAAPREEHPQTEKNSKQRGVAQWGAYI
jgi:SAM-dependent methyltransferase